MSKFVKTDVGVRVDLGCGVGDLEELVDEGFVLVKEDKDFYINRYAYMNDVYVLQYRSDDKWHHVGTEIGVYKDGVYKYE